MASSSSYFLSKLTFDRLAAWAGEAVFQRGHTYYEDERVENVVLTHEGGLLATVHGYVTLIFQELDGKLASLCTCPYGTRCKHAVALACAGLALLAEKTTIPLIEADDRRLSKLQNATSSDETDQGAYCPSTQELKATLKALSKKQLIDLVIQAVSLAPEIAALCLGNAESHPQDALSLVKGVRRAMRKALEEPDYDDYWNSYNTPDYDPVCKKLEVLRVAGFPAEVLELGLELLEDSVSQIEMYDDEGQTQAAVAECMGIVLQALRDVDWPAHKKLLWAAEAILTDEFAVCDCFRDMLHEKHDPEIWNPVADSLVQRLAKHKETGFSRRELVEMVALALDAAGREAEVLELHKQEAAQSDEYLPLVRYLLDKNKDTEAEEWIHKGIAAMGKKEPYTVERLRSILLDLRKKQKDWDCVVCMQTEDFVTNASLRQFKECRHSADKLRVWPVLRPLLMDFLIERKIPWTRDSWPCRNRGKATAFKGTKQKPCGSAQMV